MLSARDTSPRSMIDYLYIFISTKEPDPADNTKSCKSVGGEIKTGADGIGNISPYPILAKIVHRGPYL